MDTLNAYVVTFNCGRELIKPETFARHFFQALPKDQPPDILILSLQELAPIAYSFLGGSYLLPYFARLRHAVEIATRSLGTAIYINIITRNLGMTAIMAFIRQDLSGRISWLETAGVGVGVHEMGNKGAVGLRLGYSIGHEDMEMTFVAAHLAPMEDAVERRNEDFKNIVRGLVFTSTDGKAARRTMNQQERQGVDDEDESLLPQSSGGFTTRISGLYTPTSYLVFAGDLNYRTSQTKPSALDPRAWPQPTDNTADPRHYSNLLRKDQLAREMKAQRTCIGLQEASVNFPPTYKYSNNQRAVAEVDDGSSWGWAKHRWPSWCDRILYLDIPIWMKAENTLARINVHEYTALPLMSTSDHRPVALSLSLPLAAIPPPDEEDTAHDLRLHPPFNINPNWRKRRAIARRREIFVGVLAYLTLHWEGNGIILATVLGAVGGWAIIRSMLEI
ncbi:hypothetical protein MMC12_001839 [Toensbergia leucococca]|nr:hypothetical protein [Toensbergia leucococca]